MNKPKVTTVADLKLKVLGELTPEEQIWLDENPRKNQIEQMKRRYALVQELAATALIQLQIIGSEDPEQIALTILNTDPEKRTPEMQSAIELIALRKVADGTYPEEIKDNSLEFLTFMLQSRLPEDTEWSYKKTKALSSHKKEELFGFFNKEMGEGEAVKDTVGENSADSELLPPESPGMSAITG